LELISKEKPVVFAMNTTGFCYAIRTSVPADGVEVFHHATGEDELHIGLRFVIDQEVQLATVEPSFSKLVFYSDAVNGKLIQLSEQCENASQYLFPNSLKVISIS